MYYAKTVLSGDWFSTKNVKSVFLSSKTLFFSYKYQKRWRLYWFFFRSDPIFYRYSIIISVIDNSVRCYREEAWKNSKKNCWIEETWFFFSKAAGQNPLKFIQNPFTPSKIKHTLKSSYVYKEICTIQGFILSETVLIGDLL